MKCNDPKSDVTMKNFRLLKACMLLLFAGRAMAQSCPAAGSTTLYSYPNTYYPALQATVNVGATSLVIGNASTSGYGATPIAAYDIVLIIQMQGAQLNAVNTASYGDGTGTGSGYLNNTNLMAGHMEYAVAMNAVPLTGGTLSLQTGLTYAYKNSAFGTDGQYRYQIIRVPLYNNLILGANIRPPEWNGTVGGVVDLYVDGALNMSGFSIDASGTGFRGGGGKAWSGASTNTNTDFIAAYNNKSGGSKGEGIAGTPYYLDSVNSTALFSSGVDGYPGGSYDRGAPGNAGGGSTDGLMSNNSNNAGGGGGGNGGTGGGGGNSWNSNLPTGGRGGTLFAQQSPSRLVMGGGGGAGSSDGGTGSPNPGSGYASSGAPGGGIVIITASSITGTGSVLANGAAPNTTVLNDGSGGGGAGGSILVITGANSPGLTVNAKGSAGASNTGGGSAAHGPGGGGGGGIIYSNKTLAAVSVTGGAAGTTFGASPNYNATAGSGGVSSQTINVTQIPHFPIICNGLLTTQSLTASASHENNTIVIRWQGITADEVEGYEVQRSLDSTGFATIATVSPEAPEAYADLTAGNTARVIYYRIREKNVNGNLVYSNIVVIDQPTAATEMIVAPNPTTGPATLRFTSDLRASVPISLYDLTGRLIWRRQYPANPGMNVLSLDVLQKLPNGIYILQATGDKGVISVRITLIH